MKIYIKRVVAATTTAVATVAIPFLPLAALASGEGGASAGAGASSVLEQSTVNQLISIPGSGGKAPAIAPPVGPGFQGAPGASSGQLKGAVFCSLPNGQVAVVPYEAGLSLASGVKSGGLSFGISALSLGGNFSQVSPKNPVEQLEKMAERNRAGMVVSCGGLSAPDIHRRDLERSLQIHFGEGWKGFVPSPQPQGAEVQPQPQPPAPVRGLW
jgi:hypothetical protein